MVFSKRFILAAMLLVPVGMQGASPLVGKWNFSMTTPGGPRAMWLGIAEKDGALEVRFQPTGGNVAPVKNFKADGAKLTVQPNQRTVIELEAKGGKLVGTYKAGNQPAMEVTGLPAPALNRPMPKKWGKPEPIFNGKDLTGWEPIGDPAKSHWTVEEGSLLNKENGANLKSTQKFNDFKLHFEVSCPEHANSGFYLRGRYEIQLERGESPNALPSQFMGSIYGRIAPSAKVESKPGEWDKFDVTFVGRTVTVVRNGVTIIDKQEIEGITGGAIDANEDQPGPFYIQGDHTGGLKFKNITVAVPAK